MLMFQQIKDIIGDLHKKDKENDKIFQKRGHKILQGFHKIQEA